MGGPTPKHVLIALTVKERKKKHTFGKEVCWGIIMEGRIGKQVYISMNIIVQVYKILKYNEFFFFLWTYCIATTPTGWSHTEKYVDSTN